MENLLARLGREMREYGKENGRAPILVFVHPATFHEISMEISVIKQTNHFQLPVIQMRIDKAVLQGEFKLSV